jgi:hypothetical protein
VSANGVRISPKNVIVMSVQYPGGPLWVSSVRTLQSIDWIRSRRDFFRRHLRAWHVVGPTGPSSGLLRATSTVYTSLSSGNVIAYLRCRKPGQTWVDLHCYS